MRAEPGLDHGRHFGQFPMAGKYGVNGLSLSPGQFTQRRYQLLELQAIHAGSLTLERNGNIRAATANANSASKRLSQFEGIRRRPPA